MSLPHPLLTTLWEQWTAMRGDRPAPRRQDFRVERLTAQLVRRTMLLTVDDVPGGGPEFACRIVGGAIEDDFVQLQSGRMLDSDDNPLPREVMGELRDLCSDLRPRSYQGIVSGPLRRQMTMAMLALPLLSPDGARVDSLLVGMVTEPLRRPSYGPLPATRAVPLLSGS